MSQKPAKSKKGDFDPYYYYLGISPKDQPADFYRLLGVERFESDIEIIEMASDRQMSHLHGAESGDHIDDVANLLSEVSRARLCLLSPASKAEYDKQLKAHLDKLEAARTSTAEPQTSPAAAQSDNWLDAGFMEELCAAEEASRPAAVSNWELQARQLAAERATLQREPEIQNQRPTNVKLLAIVGGTCAALLLIVTVVVAVLASSLGNRESAANADGSTPDTGTEIPTDEAKSDDWESGDPLVDPETGAGSQESESDVAGLAATASEEPHVANSEDGSSNVGHEYDSSGDESEDEYSPTVNPAAANSPSLDDVYRDPNGEPPIESGLREDSGAASDDSPFVDAAKAAMRGGREKDAFQYLFAHALADEAGAAELFTNYKWVPAFNQPALAIRFGIGVHLVAPKSLSDFKPIGSKQDPQPQTSIRIIGRRGSSSLTTTNWGNQFEDSVAPEMQITKCAGEFGSTLLEEFSSRATDGDFGQVYVSLGSFSDEDSDYPFGTEYSDSEVGDAAIEHAKPISPGLTFLGVSRQHELLARAQAEGVDVLLLLKVNVKPPNRRTGLIINETSADILDVAKEAPIRDKNGRGFKSQTLNNRGIQIAREEGRDDGVDETVRGLFDFAGQMLSMHPLPGGLNAKNVKRRVGELAVGKPDNLLPVLAEIRFWNHKELLSDEDMAKAFQLLLGDKDGKTLATGSPAERRRIVEEFLK